MGMGIGSTVLIILFILLNMLLKNVFVGIKLVLSGSTL